MAILKFIFIVFEVLVLFNLIIIVHEFGHFWAARWRGLVVERFSVWFGKPIWQKEYKGVKYTLGSIPAGGFVALPQMAPMELLEGETEHDRKDLPQASVKDRIIVAFAGPLFSFLLALFFAVCIWWIGRPVSERETNTVIGYVYPDSPAKAAGLQPGDKILEIDGHPIKKFFGVGDSVQWRVISSEGKTISIQYERDGEVHTTEAVPFKEKAKALQRDSLRQLMIEPEVTPIIGKVVKHSPAARAGLKVNDAIVAINGQKLYHFGAVSDYIQKHGKEPLTLTVSRNGESKDYTLTPEKTAPSSDVEGYKIGVEFDGTGKWKLSYPGPLEQVRSSVMTMVDTFGALFSRKSDIKPEHLAGPVGIMRMYYQLFSSEHGWRMAIWFSVIFNVNLALLNLLPIPVLDGGHIIMAVVEGIIRRPINVKVLQYVQTGCALLLIGFILFLTFFDIQDLGNPFKRKEKPPEMQFEPADEAPSN